MSRPLHQRKAPLLKTFWRRFCVASVESFSSPRTALVKTWLKNNIGEERLNGLALLHQRRDILIDTDSVTVINRFAKSGNRELDFVL